MDQQKPQQPPERPPEVHLVLRHLGGAPGKFAVLELKLASDGAGKGTYTEAPVKGYESVERAVALNRVRQYAEGLGRGR